MTNKDFGVRPKIDSANGCPMFYELPGYDKVTKKFFPHGWWRVWKHPKAFWNHLKKNR